jgi:hypothetical protein
MQERSLAAGLGYDGSGMVAANIVESAQSAVVASDDNNWFAGDDGANELAWRFQLFGAGD